MSAVDRGAAAAPGAGSGPGALRVLTWNVHGLRAGADAVAQVLRDARCDVALLQEGPRGLRAVPRSADLARRSGLLVGAAGRPAAGCLVLVAARVHVHRSVVTALPVRGATTPVRGVAGAVVSLPGGPSTAVVSVHLGLTAGERADHVRRLGPVVDGLEEAVPEARDGGRAALVVGGDLNEAAGGPAWSALLPGGTDCWSAVREGDALGATFPARRPRTRIDGVLVRGGLRPRTADVVGPGPASDHRPLVVELVAPPEPAGRGT
ncbi:endonuclease/exonuclease/phosphatase family protein [Pseudokineococcus basanitobsidens]|uniref:Endonuclease/exonuclease/phosphatase family protein n=1 Tax=Pseudokineococcus basanitobsidens TaxID=1926649 RepID=A0ABU8RJ96_9ACTN